MKRCMGIALMCLTLVAGRAWAEGGAASALDWGDRVERIVTFDHTGLDFSKVENRRIVDIDNASVGAIGGILWTPDGKDIIYTDIMNGIFAVSSEGGAPRLLFDNTVLYPYNDRFILFKQPPITFGGITADGQYLYFSRALLDTASIQILDNGQGATVSNAFYVLDRLDLRTGVCEEVVKGALISVLSLSGRYMIYFEIERPNLPLSSPRLMDFSTGESRVLPVDFFHAAFTPDEQYIICSKKVDDTSTQFFRVPVAGGEPEQISTYSGGNVGYTRIDPVCAPGGEWMLYEDVDDRTMYSGTVKSEDGLSTRSYSKGVHRLCALNLNNGETFELLPYSATIDSRCGAFSPDGTKFCYMRQNYGTIDDEYGIFIRDFSPVPAGSEPLEVAENTPAAFAVSGNYPNPFNPSTTIEYAVLTPGQAELTVYDVTGRTVRVLVNGQVHAGKHAVVWNGRDNAGAPVASGTYIARLKMGNITSSHRMILVK